MDLVCRCFVQVLGLGVWHRDPTLGAVDVHIGSIIFFVIRPFQCDALIDSALQGSAGRTGEEQEILRVRPLPCGSDAAWCTLFMVLDLLG